MNSFVRILLISLCLSFCFWDGSEEAYGSDYFTAAQDGNTEHLKLVEKFHIDNVPPQITGDRLNYALGDLTYALDRYPNHPRALQLIGMVAQMLKKNELAIDRFQKAIEQFPRYSITQAQYGLYLVGIGSVDEGIKMLKRSIEIDPRFAAGYGGLAHAYVKKGDLEHAHEAAMKARELGFNGKLPDGL
jgi:tetratricopeptide (TPR) repeat protein